MDQQIRYTVTANDLLSPQLQTMNSNAQTLEGTMGGLGGAIKAAFSVYAVTSFVSSVIKAGTTVENATTGLTTLLGNAAEAGEVVKNTMEDATKTPFAFEGLLAANKALISAGVGAESARKDVLNLSNAIAATGGGDDELGRMVVNMQQIKNTGKATAQDIKQFAFAGINIYKVLAEATGKPIEKVKEMEVSYDLLTASLEKAHAKGGIYYNGLENMANNTSVRISNVGDAVFQFMNDIFIESKPMIDGVLQSVLDLISGIKDLVGWFKEHKNVTEFLAVSLGSIISMLVIYNGVQKISAMWTAFATTSMIAQTFSAAALTAGMGGASAAGMVWAGVMGVVNAVMAANPVMLIVIAIGLLIGAIYEVIANFHEWGAAVTLLMGPIGWLISAIMSIYGHWQSIKDAFNDGGIEGGLKRIGIVLLDTLLYPLQQLLELASKIPGIGDLAAEGAAKILAMRKSMDLVLPEETEKKTTKGLAGVAKKPATMGGLKPLAVTDEKKDKSKAVSGNKVVTINVTIGNLINDFQIKTTNLQESTTAIKDKVLQALTSAVNDSQIVAGQ